jgi:glycine dehydrogenase
MKLNAAAEMEAMTWPAFSQMHPFAPVEDQAGSLRLIRDLEIWLAELTGYDTVSLQTLRPTEAAEAALVPCADAGTRHTLRSVSPRET